MAQDALARPRCVPAPEAGFSTSVSAPSECDLVLCGSEKRSTPMTHSFARPPPMRIWVVSRSRSGTSCREEHPGTFLRSVPGAGLLGQRVTLFFFFNR